MKPISFLTFPFLLLTLSGCGDSIETTATTLDPPSEATLTALQKADQLDGTEDHVIGKCYVCKLSMDGDEAYTAEVHGYKARLCSSHCRDHFQASPETVIASTEIPD